MKRITSITLLVALSLVLSACNFPFMADSDSAVATSVAETVAAKEASAVKPTLAPLPTQAPVQPTATTASAVVVTEEAEEEEEETPCLYATFISETIPDGTEFSGGESFTKTWKLRNDGYCDWNVDYHLSFKSGDQMGGPDSIDITDETDFGETISISIDLTAPSDADTYTGYWQFKTDDGVAIGTPLSVKIVVE